jgi:aryl sulfotransferase
VLPKLSHTYQHHTLDSTRWERFTPRDDDIVISTPYKSGTTWTQEIVLHLIFPGGEVPYRSDVSPWLDSRFHPLEEELRQLEAQRHRRCIKSHLALDGLPFYPQLKYIVVGRDPRDVFMSLWNHYSSHTPGFLAFVNGLPDRVGDPFPPAPSDIHQLWRDWIARGWFEWEQEGYPFWGNMHHQQTWWDYRYLDNMLLVHFADLLADPFREIRGIADFLEIPASDGQIGSVVQQTSLAAMRTRAEQRDAGMENVFTGGAQTFFYKGTNGRWKAVLSAEELAMYERTASRLLTPGCRAWLEHGRSALPEAATPEPHGDRMAAT